jgi:hypothetical protein
MKTQITSRRRARGSTLMLTVVTMGLIGFVLLAYLSLVRRQNVSVARSQAWNAAIPVIEAGVEDALTHLNTHGTTNLACDGWTQVGNLYVIKRNLGENYYVSIISNWNNSQPVVDSRGFVNVPLLASAQPNWMLAVATLENPTPNYLVRAVRVRARPNALFPKGMVAKGNISFTGNALVDSFDSEYPAKSTNGRYDSAKRQEHGDVASNQQVVNAVSAGGNTKVYGKVSTGPGGTVGFQGNASAGGIAWVDGGNTGMQPGFFSDDMNVNFPDVGVPFTGGYYTPSAGSYNGTNFDYLLGNGDYYKSTSISMSSKKTMMVTGNARLYLPGGFSMSGQTRLIIAPGASLKLYLGGNADFTGQGVYNETGNATNCWVYGLTNCTQIKFTGNSAFIGVIYAPSAELKMGGGGSDEIDFSGATITGSVTMAGKYTFHYDESLARKGPGKGYCVTSWDEMTPAQAAALPAGIASALGLNQ